MMEPLEVSIGRIPSDTARVSDLALIVLPADPGSTAEELYRRGGEAPARCPAGQRAVAIVSTGELNTPDEVGANGRRRDRDSFELDLQIRRFSGSIRANDPWIALVRLELGMLDAGSYRLTVKQTVLRFADRSHPEDATDPTTTEHYFSFECVEERR